MSTLLYGSESWPMMVANKTGGSTTQVIEGDSAVSSVKGHFMAADADPTLLHFSWFHKTPNKTIRAWMGKDNIANIITKRRL